MKIVKFSLLIIVGTILSYLTYNFKFKLFFFDALIWFLVASFGIGLFLWNLFFEVYKFNTERKIKNFSLTFLGILIIGFVLILEFDVQANFNKPSLLKVFHEGDINGAGIDFKKDGTYIFDNSALGMSDYSYGNYEINGNLITLDKNNIENIISSKKLKIVEQINFLDSSKENYLYQINKKGETLINEFSFRIVKDFRNYTKKEEKNKNKTVKP